MPAVFQTINPLAEPGWDDMVAAHPAGSFFHTTSWARVLVESYGYRPVYFTFVENGALQALLPVMEIHSAFTGRRGVSLPFSDYADPFAADEDQYRLLADRAVQYGKETRWGTLEIRGGRSPWPVEGVSPGKFLGHRLDLARSEKEIFSSFRTNMQRNIARAEKDGVKIEISDSPEFMEAYYRLHCITRKDHGLPPQPLGFFRKIQEHVLRRGLGFVVLATFRQAIVAGMVFFHFGRKAIYKFGASNDAGKQCRANNLAMWEAIRWYQRKGFTEFCFGRTEGEHEGLREYKRGYGTQEYPLPYYKFDMARNRSVDETVGGAAGTLSRYYRKIPIPISRVVGTLVYRHIG